MVLCLSLGPSRSPFGVNSGYLSESLPPPSPPTSVFFRAVSIRLSFSSTSSPRRGYALSRHISLSSAAGSLTCLQHLLALADVKGRAYQ